MNIYDNLGLFEKRLRKARGYSLENIAHNIGISKSLLSDAENGKRILKPEIFSEFLKHYEIEFTFNELSADLAHSFLNHFIQAWIDRDFADEKKITKELESNRSVLQNSLGCLYLLLIDIFLSVHLYNQIPDIQVIEYLLEIENYLPFFSPDEQALIYFLKGFDAMKKKKHLESLKQYKKALKVLDGEQWPELEGIIKFNSAHVLQATVSFFQAYQVVQEARSIFVKYNNHARILLCDNNSASYLISMQEFQAAKDCIQNIIRCQNRWFHDERTYTNTTTLMILVLTLEGQFEQAIRYIHTHPFPIENGYIGNLSLIPYCHYRLGEYDKCSKIIDTLSVERPTEDDQALFDTLISILNKNSDEIEEAKLRMMDICKKQTNWCMLMVLFQLMIAYYESENETELLIDAYRQQARVLHHQLPVL